MSASSGNVGFAQKIGYSFVGLMAGNGASLAVLLLIAVLPCLGVFTGVGQFWKLDIGETFGVSVAIWIVSLVGWVVVGLPIVLLFRAEIVTEFYLITAALIGAVVGLFTMFLMFLAINQGRLDTMALHNPQTMRTVIVFFTGAALISGVAFAVYCSLVKRALRGQAQENGAPKGTPRSLAWFDF